MMKRTSSTSSSSLHHPLPPQPHRSSQSFPRPPRSLDSTVEALSIQLSKLGPMTDTYQLSQSSSSSSLNPPDPLHSLSSLVGPCETDESRGFSQYDLGPQIRSNGSSSRSLSLSTRDQYHLPAGPTESQFSKPSVPTEDQYNFPQQPGSLRDISGARTLTGPETRGQATVRAKTGLHGIPESFSPAGSLKLVSTEPSGTSTAH